MFVQIMKGRVADAALLQRQSEAWRRDLKSGATGYLGTTSGTTPDGVAVLVARFETQAAAQANSTRPEQAEWWSKTAPAFDGEVTFIDCPEVDLMFGGGSDAAGFVQLIEGRAVDPETLRAVGRTMEDELHAARPDLLGGIVAWHGDREFTQVVYFTSEADARANESKSQGDPQAAEWMKMMDGPMSFHDLPDPEFD